MQSLRFAHPPWTDQDGMPKQNSQTKYGHLEDGRLTLDEYPKEKIDLHFHYHIELTFFIYLACASAGFHKMFMCDGS